MTAYFKYDKLRIARWRENPCKDRNDLKKPNSLVFKCHPKTDPQMVFNWCLFDFELLDDWFARKNLRRHGGIYNVYITNTIQVRTIINFIIPLQSGGALFHSAPS